MPTTTNDTRTFNQDVFIPPAEGRHTFCQEASMLGLAPGDWPLRFETNLGNGTTMHLVDVDECNGHIYRQHGTPIEVLIFND